MDEEDPPLPLSSSSPVLKKKGGKNELTERISWKSKKSEKKSESSTKSSSLKGKARSFFSKKPQPLSPPKKFAGNVQEDPRPASSAPVLPSPAMKRRSDSKSYLMSEKSCSSSALVLPSPGLKRRSDATSFLTSEKSCSSSALAVPSPGLKRRSNATFFLASEKSFSSSALAVPSPVQRRRMNPTCSEPSSSMENEAGSSSKREKDPRPQPQPLSDRFNNRKFLYF